MLKKFSAFFRSHTSKRRTLSPSAHDALFLACREVSQNISEAVKFLKDQLPGFRAFHQMPWYLVLGVKNSGKTQLIAHSELTFLEKERFVQLTPQGMETKSGVNWWLSRSAVLIDVPGSYLEESSDLTPHRAAWFELLRQIRRYRFRRPLNGIILTISVKHLQKNEAFSSLQARLQEVLYRLKQQLPIYVVITKMDQLAGFHEYFDDLGKNERDHYAGLTFPLKDETKTSWVDIFSESIDRWLSNLHQRVLWRVNQESDEVKRQRILNFPHQISLLSDNLKPLIHELNSLNTHASLRGVYFTSSLTGAPSMIDHISETVEKQFALVSSKISSLSSGAPGLQRTFFIQSLFEQKIFPEASLANDVLRATASRQENFLRWGALGLAGIILLSITLTLSQHYKTQTVHLNTAAMALSDYKLLISTYSFSHPEINKLVPALDALVIADQNTAKAHLPWLLRFQLHRQAPLRDLTDQLYTRDLQTKLIPAVRYQLALTLEKGDAADTAHRYNLLKAYLMMGDPAHADKAFLHEWFYQVWQNPLAQNPDFRKHWDAAISGQIPALSSNAEVVQKTRATLNALPYELLSHAILRNEQTSDISLDIHDNTHIFLLPKTSDFKLLTASHIALANKQINEAVYIAINGNWVLGSKVSDTLPAAGLKKLQNTLMDEYVENYVSGWQQFLSKTQVHSFQSLQLLEQSLEVLTQHHSPLEQILTMVHQNTQLNDPHATLLTQKLSNRLNMQFGALNHVSLAEVQVKLQDLKTQIQTITHSQHPDIKALEVAQNMARQKGHDVILSLIQLANQMPEPLRQWLLSIAAQSRDLILSKAAAYTWQQWQLQVLPLCQSTVENHYPFAPASHKEISLYDFSRFFEKDGIFDQFFTLYLSPFVQTDLAQWQWKNVDGGRFDTAPQRLAQFERANIIKTLYFNKKNKLEASFTLSRDKDIQHYVWPVNTQNISVVLFNPEGKKKMLIMQGDWSIFRLINESKFKSLAEGKSYKLTFNHEEKQESSNYTAAYVLNAELINPFVPGVVDQFSCP